MIRRAFAGLLALALLGPVAALRAEAVPAKGMASMPCCAARGSKSGAPVKAPCCRPAPVAVAAPVALPAVPAAAVPSAPAVRARAPRARRLAVRAVAVSPQAPPGAASGLSPPSGAV